MNVADLCTPIAQTKFFQRHCAKHIRIADAALREFNDFLGDKSCCRIIFANFQLQNATHCCEGSRHALNDLKIKKLTSKKECYQHEHDFSLWWS